VPADNEDVGVTNKPKKKVDEKHVERLLEKIPLLVRMSEGDRRKIVEALQEESFKTGDFIIQQGDIADKFYLIKEGKAKVLVDGEVVGEVQDGEYFGEQGFVNSKGSRRNASIKAEGGPVLVYSLSREGFHKIFDKEQIHRLFPKRGPRQAISGITGNATQQKKISKPADAQTEKTDEDKQLIAKALAENPLMKTILDDDQVQMIITEMWKRGCAKGEDIIVEGDKGDYFYIVISGEMGVYKKSDSGDGKNKVSKKIATRTSGQSFGEIALMYNCARKATVTCEAHAELWTIDRYTFKRICTNASAQKLSEYEKFLSKVPKISRLTKFERSRIADVLEEVKFKKGQIIIKEGDFGDSFYILHSGRVLVTKTIDGKQKDVAEYKLPGGYFGERAIVRDDKRAATCTAIEPSVCLMLKRDVFELLLGPLHELMERDEEKYKQADRKGIAEGDSAGGDDGALIRTHFKGVADFHVVGILGKGSFGSVKLVEANGKRYALKAVGKERVFSLGQQEHIMNERNIMLHIHHPFIVDLYQTFQDHDYLYFLLEPSLGGELFSVLREKQYFKQEEARFFAASVVLVFEYLHSKDIIYRDLKPENLLLDNMGYLKVTDFGFAKEVKDRTWTLCGTPDYLAPEIIGSRSHGKGVDWWTLGILIYEMLVSYPPFYHPDPMKVYSKIMACRVKYPNGFNKNARSLIDAILKQRPSQRLGVVQGGASKVKAHPWFKGFKWDALIARKVQAPIVQPVNNRDPLMNFEEYDNYSETEPYNGDNKVCE